MVKKIKQKIWTKGGYTIIETMISVSLFLIIVMTGMSALLNANLLHRKSQDMRSIVDNMSFIMDEVARNIRTGYDYHCIDSTNSNNPADVTKHSCVVGGGISFTIDQDQNVRWVYRITTGGILQKSSDGGTSFTTLTPPEVNISSASGFSVLGAEGSPNKQQPFVTVRLVGTITIPGKNVLTPFSIQTSLSQRQVDI